LDQANRKPFLRLLEISRDSIAFKKDLTEIESGLEETRLGTNREPIDGLIDIFGDFFPLQIVDPEIVSRSGMSRFR
jgi:hypothetical protein